MLDIDNRAERNKLRSVVLNAEDRQIMTKEEAGFVVSLVERFRNDIEKKIKQLHVLQGEISQLRTNESIIVDLIENMIASAERDIARQETMTKLKAAQEIKEERKKALKDNTLAESVDNDEEIEHDIEQEQ